MGGVGAEFTSPAVGVAEGSRGLGRAGDVAVLCGVTISPSQLHKKSSVVLR